MYLETSEKTMTETVLVTSCKGGIGKSTVAANLSLALALDNYRVVAVDCDFRMRCLDLIMGHENEAMFDLCDVIQKRCTLERALVKDGRADGLYFLAAPSGRHTLIDANGFSELIRELKRCTPDGAPFDYIVLDAPAADDDAIALCAPESDQAIVVCSHMPSAIRAANFTCELLDEYSVRTQRLLINSFDAKSALSSNRTGIIDIIDQSKTRLLGIVPYDRALMLYQEKGELIDKLPKRNNARAAFVNIAKRLTGRQVALFDRFVGKEYKRILNSGNNTDS